MINKISIMLVFILIFTGAFKSNASNNINFIFGVNFNNTLYSSELGYGFIDNTNIKEASNSFYANTPFSFQIDIENGDYEVILKTGDDSGKTEMNVLINGANKLSALNIEAGTFVEKSVIACVIDNKMVIDFTGNLPRISSIEIKEKEKRQAAKTPTVYLAGDSTVQTYGESDYPQAGWGQYLSYFYNKDIKFINRAIGGRSSKSFYVDGRLDNILSVINPNDYLLIQFGHNDADKNKPERFADAQTTYKEYLKKYIDGAINRDAIPVLITPVSRRSVDENGKFQDNFSEYTKAMKEVALEKNVILIDLSEISRNYLDAIGFDKAKELYFWTKENESKKYPKGTSDDTHFKSKGAYEIARILATELNSKIDFFNSNSITTYSFKSEYNKTAFTDITSHWSKLEIEKMADLGIIKGKSDNIFAPDDNITRMEFLALLTRTLNLEEVEYNNEFSDISKSYWGANIIKTALLNNLITKSENFSPDTLINRENMTVTIMNAYRLITKETNIVTPPITYNDQSDISDFAINDIKTASDFSIVKGTTEMQISPKNNVTRAEATVILSRFYDLLIERLSNNENN